MRDLLTTILEVVGIGVVCAGVFTLNVSAGLIVTGVACVVLGWLVGGGAQE